MEDKELLQYGHERGIFNICQELHMTNTGAYQDMSKYDYEMGLKFLKYKLIKWTEGLPDYRDYEFAVRFLIKETIVECETSKFRINR